MIYDADDQESLVKNALRELNMDDKKSPPQRIHAAISTAKNNLIQADDYLQQNYRDEVQRVSTSATRNC